MNKLFFWFLKRKLNTEKGRREIFKKLHESVSEEYREQTIVGNVYNSYIEFLMSNDVVQRMVKSNISQNIKILKAGLENSFDDAVEFIKSEYSTDIITKHRQDQIKNILK